MDRARRRRESASSLCVCVCVSPPSALTSARRAPRRRIIGAGRALEPRLYGHGAPIRWRGAPALSAQECRKDGSASDGGAGCSRASPRVVPRPRPAPASYCAGAYMWRAGRPSAAPHRAARSLRGVGRGLQIQLGGRGPAVSGRWRMVQWVFGYGSLVWRADFPYQARRLGYLQGWERVWWQGSTDHRGTPEAPGRTVTLHRKEGARVWGMAYQIGDADEAQVMPQLEYREKQYDLRVRETVYSVDDAPIVQDCLVYVATPKSANYLGPASLQELAQTIATAEGPSGPNHEYCLRLAEAMRSLGLVDEGLFELEAEIRSILQLAPAGSADNSS
eukprot:scaffold1305_cov374-Prasinococcus_capsulatus_cf.AAC.6